CTRPMIAPARTPIITERAIPSTRRPRLGSTSATNAGPIQVSTNAFQIFHGAGKNFGDVMVAEIPQITSRMIGSATAYSVFSVSFAHTCGFLRGTTTVLVYSVMMLPPLEL